MNSHWLGPNSTSSVRSGMPSATMPRRIGQRRPDARSGKRDRDAISVQRGAQALDAAHGVASDDDIPIRVKRGARALAEMNASAQRRCDHVGRRRAGDACLASIDEQSHERHVDGAIGPR